MGGNIKIGSDQSACDKIPVKKNAKLPDQLQNLLSVLPTIDEMPKDNMQAAASIDMLRQVREKLKQLPTSPTLKDLEDIAVTMANSMKN